MKMQFGSGIEEGDSNERVLDPSAVAMKMHAKPYISDTQMDPSSFLVRIPWAYPLQTLTRLFIEETQAGWTLARTLWPSLKCNLEFSSYAWPNKSSTIRSSVNPQTKRRLLAQSEHRRWRPRKRVMNSFGNQRRAVTLKDYDTMAYAMPYKFGALKRVKTIKNPNPRRGNLNVAVISEDSNGRLVASNSILKENLKTWIDKSRMVSDVVEIVDAKILNFGVDFNVVGDLNKDSSVILQNCINALTDHFSMKATLASLSLSQTYTRPSLDGVIDVVDVSVSVKQAQITASFLTSTTTCLLTADLL